MAKIQFQKPVVMVRRVRPQGVKGARVETLFKRNRTGTSKELRPLEKTIVRLVSEQQRATEKYLRLHNKSNDKEPGGWAEDYPKNVVKAYRKLDEKWLKAIFGNRNSVTIPKTPRRKPAARSRSSRTRRSGTRLSTQQQKDTEMVDAAKPSDAATKDADDAPVSSVVIVDLGWQSRKKLKRLRRGEGRLMDEVAETIRRLREAGEIEAGAAPVVFVAREKIEARPALPWIS